MAKHKEDAEEKKVVKRVTTVIEEIVPERNAQLGGFNSESGDVDEEDDLDEDDTDEEDDEPKSRRRR